nr:immunoglobulin heavy chain junction region [Mus musculus]MBK4185862.1 immunoglobulin heavy chain junction region [Mus musculus]MBK4185863.1 immunoglobulin heavy chain junction region [Mus musculus]MBK4185864.1 immunoglobulin heavy chain junction region [Mus musculus]MBK4185868.1 immunoglobulin heavy chain junction region [Mus musculus]
CARNNWAYYAMDFW